MARGEGGFVLVDPGIDGPDLNQFADDLDRLGVSSCRRVLHPSPLGPPALASPARRRCLALRASPRQALERCAGS